MIVKIRYFFKKSMVTFEISGIEKESTFGFRSRTGYATFCKSDTYRSITFLKSDPYLKPNVIVSNPQHTVLTKENCFKSIGSAGA
jgi:hypothetical protein